jgi:hypothetical protein
MLANNAMPSLLFTSASAVRRLGLRGALVLAPWLLFAGSGACARAQLYDFTTLAGRASIGSSDGVGSDARFSGLQGVAVDASGNVFVADTKNHTIRRIAPDGTVSTIAGAAAI